jgi:hypothetical protein
LGRAYIYSSPRDRLRRIGAQQISLMSILLSSSYPTTALTASKLCVTRRRLYLDFPISRCHSIRRRTVQVVNGFLKFRSGSNIGRNCRFILFLADQVSDGCLLARHTAIASIPNVRRECHAKKAGSQSTFGHNCMGLQCIHVNSSIPPISGMMLYFRLGARILDFSRDFDLQLCVRFSWKSREIVKYLFQFF